MREICIINIDFLIGHEEINKEYLKSLKNEIASDKILKRPIVVDKNTNIVLDGHHRLSALKELGCTKIPVIFVDYQSPEIDVQSWNGSEKITKDIVIIAGKTGKKLNPKSSRHLILNSKKWIHISVIEEYVNLPLENLR